jgi:hypothetical protein
MMIDDPSVVSKSWPDYWEMFGSLTSAASGAVVVAAFDVDGTLTRRDSLVPFLWQTSASALVLGLLRRPATVVRALVRRDRDRLKELAVHAVFAGRSAVAVRDAGARPKSGGQPGWMQSTGSPRAQSASIASMSRSAKAR